MRPTTAVTVATVAALLLAAAPGPAGGQTSPRYDDALDLSFPVAGPVEWEDDYDEERDGGERAHQGTDFYGAKLQRVHAAAAGVVCDQTTAEAAVGGYQIIVCGDGDRRYVYTHFNDDSPGTDDGAGGLRWAYAPSVRAGTRVQRGQWLGYMGDSGNAEDDGAQLHFAITDPAVVDPALARPGYRQGRRNPYPSLVAAVGRGDVPAEAVSRRRLAGATRVETAAALAEDLASAPAVVVVPARTHAAALVAGPLAQLVGAPVLLAEDRLAPAAAAVVRRLGATHAVLVGAVPDAVVADLRAAGVTAVERVTSAAGGASSAADAEQPAALSAADVEQPAALSAAVADRMAALAEVPRVFVAAGAADDPARASPDPLGASAYAAFLRAPVLLTHGDRLDPEVATALSRLAPSRVTVVGGPAAVSARVADAAGQAAGAPVDRLAGPDRYGTSVAVASAAVADGMTAPGVWLATGLDFADALTAGPAAARAGAPLVLVDGARRHWDDVSASAATQTWLAENAERIASLVTVGGAAAVTLRAELLAAGVAAG